MDINIPEIVDLTARGLITLTIILGLIDTVFAVLAAIAQKTFSPAYVADFLLSHGKIWLAIGALAVLGQGIPQLDVPAIGAAHLAAVAGLTAYAITVVNSLIQNSRNAAPPPTADTQ